MSSVIFTWEAERQSQSVDAPSCSIPRGIPSAVNLGAKAQSEGFGADLLYLEPLLLLLGAESLIAVRVLLAGQMPVPLSHSFLELQAPVTQQPSPHSVLNCRHI